MDAAKSVTATFGPSTFRLATTVRGKGTVRSTPAGIACTKSCAHSFDANGAVRLVAKPGVGWRFSAWTGACHGAGACVVRLTKPSAVVATFLKKK